MGTLPSCECDAFHVWRKIPGWLCRSSERQLARFVLLLGRHNGPQMFVWSRVFPRPLLSPRGPLPPDIAQPQRDEALLRAFGDQIAASLDMVDAILEGEVIAVDETGRPNLRTSQAQAGAHLSSSILLWLDSADSRTLPQSERRRRLRDVLPKKSAMISEALSVTGKGRKLFDLECAHDLEGVVAKRLKDPYGPRVKWWKIQNRIYTQAEGWRELFDRSAGATAALKEPIHFGHDRKATPAP